jgi:hydroxysqualene dehydroxylase
MFGPEPDASAILLPAVPLDDLYAHPAADFLRGAGSFITSNAPARIEIGGGRVIGVRVRDEVIPADVAISAVPWFAFPALFDAPPASLTPVIGQAASLRSVPIVTVNVWLDSRVGDPLLGLPGRTFQWVFDRRAIVGPTQTHLSLVSSGAEHICEASNDEVEATAIADLRSAIPDLDNGRIRHTNVVRERRATFSLEPGRGSRPSTVTPVDGLLLAGDWIATGLPATIEGAVSSGHAAARAALRL